MGTIGGEIYCGGQPPPKVFQNYAIKWVLLEGPAARREIYCGGGWHWEMIFWGQYIVSPRAQTTQTIPPREDQNILWKYIVENIVVIYCGNILWKI